MKSTRNLWPYGIIAAFVLFFIGMAVVIIIAATHRDHLVSSNYYEQELKFQTSIDASDRAKISGATVTFEATSGHLTIALPVAQLTQKLVGTVKFYRPSTADLDREFQLEPKPDGTQTLNVSDLAAGLWLVRVAWNANGMDYQMEQKIKI